MIWRDGMGEERKDVREIDTGPIVRIKQILTKRKRGRNFLPTGMNTNVNQLIQSFQQIHSERKPLSSFSLLGITGRVDITRLLLPSLGDS